MIKQWRGLWLPEGEKHLIEWMQKTNRIVNGRPTYQYSKIQAALSFVSSWRTAVDVGAHCGLWSMHLARHFNMLHAFEPVDVHRRCWRLNVDDSGRWPLTLQLHDCALGDHNGKVSIHTAPTSSGDSWVNGGGDIELKRLDEFGLTDLDFLKIDCEGYELFVLRGAEKTLKRCRPCVIVEQKPGRAQRFGLPETGAIPYLEGLGAKLRRAMSGDFIMSWGEHAGTA